MNYFFICLPQFYFSIELLNLQGFLIQTLNFSSPFFELPLF
jgi:hypothetical protein